jgi:cystathionine beta-lyase family protein involved in aluminum resistance
MRHLATDHALTALHDVGAGLWLAPVVVGEALKGALLIAATMRRLGYQVWPVENSLERPSFITAIELGSEAKMTALCRTLQRCSPVGAYVVPEPGMNRSIAVPWQQLLLVLRMMQKTATTAAKVSTPHFPIKATSHICSKGIVAQLLDMLHVCGLTEHAGCTPGYEDPVIFADGTFIDGSTSEMSADGPIRAPYTVFCQGGVHWTQWAQALKQISASDVFRPDGESVQAA